MDRSTLGQPGKFSLCLAEDEEDSPWLALAQERGVPEGTSAVTVMAVSPPRQVMNEWTDDPEEICETLGVTDGNQRVLLHRARARVRSAIEEHLGV